MLNRFKDKYETFVQISLYFVQKMPNMFKDIVVSALVNLYWPKSRMAASSNTLAESHKRTLTFVFTL